MHVIVNGKSPFLDSYRFDKHSAGQSFLHFLIIPRNNGTTSAGSFPIRTTIPAIVIVNG